MQGRSLFLRQASNLLIKITECSSIGLDPLLDSPHCNCPPKQGGGQADSSPWFVSMNSICSAYSWALKATSGSQICTWSNTCLLCRNPCIQVEVSKMKKENPATFFLQHEGLQHDCEEATEQVYSSPTPDLQIFMGGSSHVDEMGRRQAGYTIVTPNRSHRIFLIATRDLSTEGRINHPPKHWS